MVFRADAWIICKGLPALQNRNELPHRTFAISWDAEVSLIEPQG